MEDQNGHMSQVITGYVSVPNCRHINRFVLEILKFALYTCKSHSHISREGSISRSDVTRFTSLPSGINADITLFCENFLDSAQKMRQVRVATINILTASISQFVTSNVEF